MIFMSYVYLYTGTGAGKTTNGLGLALRCIAHKKKVIIIQFMKWWKKTGEYKIRNKLKPYYEIYQFGRKGWIGFKNLDEKDRKLAKKALDFAKKIAKKKKPHLLVLDEINLAVYCKLLSVKEVLDFLDQIPKKTHVVLTGRYASKELKERADFVNVITDVKHPKKIPTTKGIQW
jgi:cob(I)alamin adenosyltransferase